MNKKSFSMIELTMVVVIVGVLASIILPKYTSMKEQAKIDQTRQNLENLRMAIEAYYMTYKLWPNSDLSNLVLKTSTWGDRSYIEEIPPEAMTPSNAVKNGSVDGAGGWVWDTVDHEVYVNLLDDPIDPRKKYSEW